MLVQCQPESTPESVFVEALGQLDVYAEIKRSGTSHVQGHIDLAASGELGNFLLGKAKLEASAGGEAGKDDTVDHEPVGRTPANLAWIARILLASGKRLVVEDFHYVTEVNRKVFAFMLKALGDYGVHVIVVGIWPDDHLLTYYNGDLDGRIEDIHLRWEEDDLSSVLSQGAQELNVRIDPAIKAALVADAYENVGLVQRLAEALCISAGVLATQAQETEIADPAHLEAARTRVSRSMDARYNAFADNFVRGMKRMTEGLEVYKHMLRAFTACSPTELLEGIDSRELLSRIEKAGPKPAIRQSDLTQALARVDRLQVKIGVRPLVLTYSRDRRRLFLADRSFLFYRQYGSPTWPWEKDESWTAAIAAALPGEQLRWNDDEFFPDDRDVSNDDAD